jgi:hypothetical protein
MAKGGARLGAGRKKGGKNQVTLEKLAVLSALRQRIMLHADQLFNAQYKLAVGSQQVFRIDKVGEGKNARTEHTLVTDPEEIKQLLDEHDGNNGHCNDHYYYFQTVPPNNQALDSLLNRSFGRPETAVEIKSDSVSAVDVAREIILGLVNQGYSEKEVQREVAKHFPEVEVPSNAVH